ncbi:MAG: class I SAM-dependent methyltransferase [Acidobacteriaceae bacterium]|nr:class I SAM-dependent methyltransferase [Acidobacteriaceae bacterium]
MAVRNVRAALWVRRDIHGFARLHFLCAADQVGLIAALEKPATAVELAARIGVTDHGLLESLLDVGVAVSELACRGGRYSLKGGRIRAMATRSGDALRAMVVEVADYHGSVYHHLPGRLAGRPRGRYVDRYDEVIARASMFMEPYITRFVEEVVRTNHARTLLEIGCGSGIYLRAAARASNSITGVGIDVSERAVELASRNLQNWGVADRFHVRHADIRVPDPELAGPYDIISLHNNIYYFGEDERADLFADLKRRLAPHGKIILVSLFKGKTISSADLDLVLRSTEGNSPLPERTELSAVLRDAGFTSLQLRRLLPNEPLYGIVAAIGSRE